MLETNFHSFGKVSFDITNANFEILRGMTLLFSVPFLLLFLFCLEVEETLRN